MKIKLNHEPCPRCWEELNPPRTALSRLSTDSERYYVCADCGVEEALEQFHNGVVTDWRLGNQ